MAGTWAGAKTGTGVLAVAIADHGEFGKVCVGANRDQLLTLVNTGTRTLSIIDVNSSSPTFRTPDVAGYPLRIAPGTAIHLPIRFQPTTPMPATGIITIDSDDPAGPKMIRVSGIVPTPRLTVLIAGGGNFAETCVGSFVDEQLILCNSGDCVLSLASITSTSAEFLVPQLRSYPITIGPNTSLPVPIRFQPASVGPKDAALIILSNDAASPSRVPLSGGALATGVELFPDSLCNDFHSSRTS